MRVNGSDIEIEISASSGSAAKNIDALANSMRNLKESFSGGTSKFKKMADALREVSSVAKEFETSYAAVGKIAKSLERLSTMGRIKIPTSIGDGIRNIGEAAATVTPEGVSNLDAMTRALQRLQNVDLRGVRSALGAAGANLVNADNQAATVNVSGTDTNPVMSAAGEAADEAKGKIQETTAALDNAKGATQRARAEISKLGKSASTASGRLSNMLSALKRIALYRFLRTIIKEITQAFQEGLKNAYEYSRGIMTEGHRFSAALDSMSSAGLKMKNQLGSAFISLLAAIAPIVNAIIGFITKIADALSQLFAIFTGGTYLKAADVPAKWADAAGGAAKAAKEWKNQLLGFDEINRLEEPTDPSGGGGGTGALDPSKMFVDTPISGIFAKIRDELIKFKDSLDFGPLKKAWEELKSVMSRFAEFVERRIGFVWETYLKPLAKWTIEKGLPLVIEDLAAAFGLVLDILEDLEPVIEAFETNVVVPFMKWDLKRVEDGLRGLGDIIERIDGLVNGNISVEGFFNGISDSIMGVVHWLNPTQAMFDYIAKWLGQKLSELLKGVREQWAFSKQSISESIEKVVEKVTGLKKSIEEFIQSLSSHLGNGKIEWQDFAIVAVNAITAPINAIMTLIGWIQSACQWIQHMLDGFSLLKTAKENVNANLESFGVVDFGGYAANGGYFESGQMFIARESGAGAELVGNIGGRTGVASNDDILNGIRQGVYEAVSAAMSNGGNNDVSVKVYLDSREIKSGQSRLNRALGVS